MMTLVWLAKIVAVIALLGVAAVMATPRGRLPLALRGLKRIVDRDRAAAGDRPPAAAGAAGDRPHPAKRFIAFLLVILALIVAAL